ncbi:ATP12 family chaperone protein [Sphingomonas morindae]|uniref:ATPase n=1 Tax=Sphingomonas morindae TaxID=1541170 RepID=A0ABY4XCN0_9SPHN|nr:ATP12 family protein [Sphingomonas morindae]USI74594.1 ATPase [Sphingomonas morindae]
MRRFWSEVTVAEGGIRLDDKPVRTPARAPLRLPTQALAEAIAEEWRGVGETLDPRAMPLTGLANAAIDRIAPDSAAFAGQLAAYAETDLLCYRADGPASLVARQALHWDPPLDWARRHFGVDFTVTEGIVHVAQPPATVARLATALGDYDAFALAGLSPLTTLSGSLVLALAMAEGAIDAEPAWQAAELDQLWQAEQWGEDNLATAARVDRHAAFTAAARFLALLA